MKRLARRFYPSLASSLTKESRTSGHVLCTSVYQIVKREMATPCGKQECSIIGSSLDAVENFSFSAVWCEMMKYLPTLTTILGQIKPDKKNKLPIICLIVSILLKQRSRKMVLVQRMISLLLYGNGASNSGHGRQNMQYCTHDDVVTWCDEISNGVKAKYIVGFIQLFFCVLIVLNYILDCLYRAALESCHALSPF